MDLIDIFSSGGLGSIVGTIGGLFTKHLELKKLSLDYSHKKEMRELDQREAAFERRHELEMVDKNIERSQVEGEISVNHKDADAFFESQRHPSGQNNSWLRPFLTLYLTGLSTLIMAAITYYSGGFKSISPEIMDKLFYNLIMTTVFLWVTACTWWYASRPANILDRVFKK